MNPGRKISKKHAVLLEYTLLLCSILPLVFAVSNSVYGLFGSGGFGTIGRGIVQFYQRIVTVVSLPIP